MNIPCIGIEPTAQYSTSAPQGSQRNTGVLWCALARQLALSGKSDLMIIIMSLARSRYQRLC